MQNQFNTGPIGSVLHKALLLDQDDATELWLIRHAEPDRSQNDPDSLSPDPPLSQRGIVQANLLAERLENSNISAIYSSPISRTMETAQIIAKSLGLTVITLADISEIRFYAHRPLDAAIPALKETMVRYQREIERAFLATGRWTAFPFCETGLEFRKRITDSIEEIAQHHRAERVVLVTHGPVINGYLAHLLDLRPDMWFYPEYTSINIVRAFEGRRIVHTINDTAHVGNRTIRIEY